MGGLGGNLRTIDWGSQKLERFEKNFYVEDKRVAAMTDREVEEFRRAKEIKVCESQGRKPAGSLMRFFQGSRTECPQTCPLF